MVKRNNNIWHSTPLSNALHLVPVITWYSLFYVKRTRIAFTSPVGLQKHASNIEAVWRQVATTLFSSHRIGKSIGEAGLERTNGECRLGEHAHTACGRPHFTISYSLFYMNWQFCHSLAKELFAYTVWYEGRRVGRSERTPVYVCEENIVLAQDLARLQFQRRAQDRDYTIFLALNVNLITYYSVLVCLI